MSKLIDDVKPAAEWVVECFKSDHTILDYSLESLSKIDQFISDNTIRPGVVKPQSRLSINVGTIMFSLGCYLGETIIRNTPGTFWETNDDEPDERINTWIKFPNGGTAYPVQRVMKRFQNGEEDSISFYGKTLSSEYGVDSNK